MFQATKWSWKRLAARALLIPVLAGSAGVAHAQFRSSGPAGNSARTASGPVMTSPAPGDPKGLLKEGRKALSAGHFNDAQDYARRAEDSAKAKNMKWGLFDDTPASLMKDVKAAVVKAQKHESERLVKQAKTLLSKRTANDREKAVNLDTALQMARRADSLHGNYSVWELGDRPDKLVKEIETARARMKLPPIAANNGVVPAVGSRMPGAPSGVVPAGGVKPPITPAPQYPTSQFAPANAQRGNPAALDPHKAAAIRLMAEGKQHANQGDYAGAQAKYAQAQKLNARFAANEFSPDAALQDLNLQGSLAIKSLIEDAKLRIGKKDYAKADAALNEAHRIATALNLFPGPIESAKTALRMATNGKYGGVSPSGLSPAAGADRIVPLGPASAAPVVPPVPTPGIANVGGPPNRPTMSRVDVPPLPIVSVPPVNAARPDVPAIPTPVATTAKRGSLTGQELIEKASLEVEKGDFELARKLALQAYNLGQQQQASSLLNTIDVEVAAAKRRNAERSYQAAVQAYQRRDHGHALSAFAVIDPNLLPADQRAKRDEMIASCKAELDKSGGSASVQAAGGPVRNATGSQPIPEFNPPGTARVGEGAGANPNNLANQAHALRNATVQKLRAEGLKVTSDAGAAFGRGETDVAIQMLLDFSNRVRAAGLDSASASILLRPIDARLESFRVMKAQRDAVTRVNRETRDAKDLVMSRASADEQRKAEVSKLVRQCQALAKDHKYQEAERFAMQAKQLDPDNPALEAMRVMYKTQKRLDAQTQRDRGREEMFADSMGAAENEGPYVDVTNPVNFEIQRTLHSRGRGRGDDAYIRSRTPKEFEIELKLDRPLSINYTGLPLSEVIEDLRERTKLDFSWDTQSLTAEQVSTAIPITEKLGQTSLRNALHLILSKAKLNFVIEYDTVRITTEKMAKGRLVTKVFSVADLVTPIPNFAIPEYSNFEKMITQSRGLGSGFYPGNGSGLLPARDMLGGGVPTGAQMGATLSTSGNAPVGVGGDLKFGGSARLENDALTRSSTAVPERGTKHEQLMRLITSMVRPLSWEAQMGPGKIEFFDLGSALVVNQTADVIREVSDLLEALRKLQDLAVAVEVRIISLSESWFERMGVDFSMNIKTNTSNFEPSLTSGQFRPEPFINDINNKGVVTGLQPSGTFTPDLDVPIRATSYQYAIPGFGGYPNNPGNDGGISLGLAFLNDIQVYMFMEAAQGDRRVNVMQAPKLTMFNGQTATINISNLQFFVTSVQVFSVNGQVVFIPQITPLPGPGGSAQTGNRIGIPGNITVALQSVVSADRRFVRINLPITLSAQSGANVPLFPITTFITPVFEGGSQGVPIPFTQFIQQPAFITMNISTTVVCPDGGTVLLGGLKQLSEGRNEFGPPFLSNIPYLNRLFKNVGIGRDTSHVMIMVTPRIIINSEEEINQTEGAPLGAGGPPR